MAIINTLGTVVVVVVVVYIYIQIQFATCHAKLKDFTRRVRAQKLRIPLFLFNNNNKKSS